MSEPILEKTATNPKLKNPSRLIVILLSLLIILVLVIGSLLLYFQMQNAQPRSTLSVKASAQREVDPDIATSRFYVTFKGPDTNDLNKKADENTNKILNFLLDSGIKNRDIESNRNSFEDYSQLREPSSSSRSSAASGKVVEVSFKVNFVNFQDNLQKPNEVLGKLGQFGVDRYSNFEYSLMESKKQEICESLQSEAIKKTLENSQKQLDALGGGTITKKEVKNVTSCDNVFFLKPYAIGAVDAEMSAQEGESMLTKTPPVLAGKETLSAEAEILIEYKGK